MGYVYRHIRLDKQEPFYIGIGGFANDNNYSRATSKQRNKIWHDITSKTQYEVEILLDDLSTEQAQQKEIELIKLYGRINTGTGILANLTDGGEGNHGWKVSDETKKKMSQSMTGIKRSREYVEQMIKRNTGRKLSEDAKAKLLQSITGRPVSNETRGKISAANAGRKRTDTQKTNISRGCKGKNKKGKGPILVYKNDKQIGEFVNHSAACDILKLNRGNAYLALTGKRNHCHGYTFKLKAA